MYCLQLGNHSAHLKRFLSFDHTLALERKEGFALNVKVKVIVFSMRPVEMTKLAFLCVNSECFHN